jgi:flagellar biosynthesis/type III secretory pathway protein FliH
MDKKNTELKHEIKATNSKIATNIVTIQTKNTRVIQSFTPTRLHDTKNIKYQQSKDSKFKIHELIQGVLGITADEEKKIEQEIERRLQERLDALEEVTKKKAYREGYEAGKEQAFLEVQEQAKPLIETFMTLIHDLENLKTQILKANEDILIKMVYRIAKMICLKEIQEDSAYTLRLLTQLIEKLDTKENIKIYVSEEMISSAEQLRAGLVENLGQLNNISIEVAHDIQDAGVKVETNFAEVDARIQVQLENIASSLGVETP